MTSAEFNTKLFEQVLSNINHDVWVKHKHGSIKGENTISQVEKQERITHDGKQRILPFKGLVHEIMTGYFRDTVVQSPKIKSLDLEVELYTL